MTDKQNTAVCFSGHRYYAAAPEDEARLAEAVEAAWSDGYRVFISGMAPGFDLAAAEAVVRLRERSERRQRILHPTEISDIKLIAAVPFRGQPRGYSPVDLARYEALLAAADEVVVLSEGYFHGCYYRRDEWMVDRSGRIVCWYDGRRSGSGTRYTVRRAVKSGLEVVNLFRDPDGTLF
jgi:uncharacterized phage-like protein YoqJ